MPARRLGHKFVPRVWGATNLAPLFTNPTDERIGEVWLETVPGIPLLIKFLFTTEKLSVQVHPRDEYAQKYGHARGKTEMWHILSAEPDAKIAAGFVKALSPQEMRSAAESGAIMNLLAWHEAKPGDTFFLPAGTVHAIGEGLMLCEIQQESDVTYRLFDYGRPRELHLDHGMAVSNLGPANVKTSAHSGVLVACPEFQTAKVSIQGTQTRTPECDELWIAIAGSGTIDGQAMNAGTAWHVPPSTVTISGDLTLLITSTGK